MSVKLRVGESKEAPMCRSKTAPDTGHSGQRPWELREIQHSTRKSDQYLFLTVVPKKLEPQELDHIRTFNSFMAKTT